MKERPIPFSGSMVRALLAGTKRQTRRLLRLPFPESERRIARIVPCPGADLWEAESDDGRGLVWHSLPCPYGVPGSRLWVRENWRVRADQDAVRPRDLKPCTPWYCATGNGHGDEEPSGCAGGLGKKRSWMFMPRWASRITLEVTEVRVRRLQEISEEDAIAEGIGALVPPDNRREGLTPGALAMGAAAAVAAMDRSTRRSFLTSALAASLGFAAGANPWEVASGPLTRGPRPSEFYSILWDLINGRKAPWSANPWVWTLTFRRLAP